MCSNEFKVGDEVICCNSNDANFLIFGDMYLVKEVCYGGTHITLKSGFGYAGGESSYSVNRFELAKEGEIETT